MLGALVFTTLLGVFTDEASEGHRVIQLFQSRRTTSKQLKSDPLDCKTWNFLILSSVSQINKRYKDHTWVRSRWSC